MQLIKSTSCEINYLSKIVKINEFFAHPNPEVTRLKCCKVDGYTILVSIDSKPGWYVYCPTLSELNPDFLRYANLYSDAALNNNPSKKGLFNSNGRVSAVKLKGCVSEGFIFEVDILSNYIIDSFNKPIEFTENLEFDTIEDNGRTCWFSKKFIPKVKTKNQQPTQRGGRKREVKQLAKSRLVDGQFRFHYDTTLIKKCPNVIDPDDYINISEKWHGTSHISAKLLCYPDEPWTMKVTNFFRKLLCLPALKPEPVYAPVYASRKRLLNDKANIGYYGCDVWAHAHKFLLPHLADGMTIYAEIVGYLPTGGYIQKNYDYGCIPPTDKYKPEINFKVRIYRITITDKDGKVTEWQQDAVQEWCKAEGLTPVIECYHGRACALYPNITVDENWCDNFINTLSQDAHFHMEKNSIYCRNNVPHEGVVIKIARRHTEAWKLKCFAFVNGEQKALDNGETNIEDEQ